MIGIYTEAQEHAIEFLPCLTAGFVLSPYEMQDGTTELFRDGFFVQFTWITLGIGVRYETDISNTGE